MASLALLIALGRGGFGCKEEPPPATELPSLPKLEERGRALLGADRRLPERAEVVALADELAIEASKRGRTPEALLLSRLAADLRARLYRVHKSETDGREALELYTAARGWEATSDAACEADLRHAFLHGELVGDAGVTYRELYLASRRRAGASDGPPPADEAACPRVLDRALAAAVTFRPSPEKMTLLEREGDRVEAEARRSEAPLPIPTATSAPVASASSAPVASGASRDVVVSPAATAVPTGPARVTEIQSFGSSDKGARIVIHLDAPAAFEVGTLPADPGANKDDRIFIDIAKAKRAKSIKDFDIGGAVRRVRAGPRKEIGGTRVVLDLSRALYRRIFYLPEPFRIVVDVSTRPPVVAEATELGGERAVRRVVLDPGHGGEDSGAVGATGLEEKGVALDIAHRAASVLSHELGIETLLTRDRDVFVPLEERTARANAFHADLFVSIHCNASEDGLARGVETFVLDSAGRNQSLSPRLAALENQMKAGSRIDPSGMDSEMRRIVTDLGGAGGPSRHLAELLQRATMASLKERHPDLHDNGVKTAGFYVLAGADMPAVLFETSFISNSEDEGNLRTAEYRQRLADSIVNAIRAYREGK